jgi:hypothetical protein
LCKGDGHRELERISAANLGGEDQLVGDLIRGRDREGGREENTYLSTLYIPRCILMSPPPVPPCLPPSFPRFLTLRMCPAAVVGIGMVLGEGDEQLEWATLDSE